MFNNIFQKYITVKNIIFFVMLLLFITVIIRNHDIAIMFFASYVIACSLNPLVDKIEPKFKSRSGAAATVLGSALLLVAAFVIPIIVLVVNEIKNFYSSIPTEFNDIYQTIMHLPFIGKLGPLQLDWQSILSAASNYTSDIFGQIINIGLNVSSAIIYLIISIIVIYYFMADTKIMRETYLKMFPHNMRERAGEIIDIISQKIGGYIIALLATIACIGIVMTAGLALFKIEYAVLLGLITAILDVIPIIGPSIAFSIALISTFNDGIGATLAVVGVFAVAQLLENQFVRPYVFGKFLDLHPIMIYLFMFICAKYMGAVGIVFAPAIAATVVVLIQELYMKNLD